MEGDGVVQSLFNQALVLLVSFICGGSFPLDALAYLPLVMRRRVFLLLPMVELHRLERHHPAATEGIDMAKVWKEVFSERLCENRRGLTKPHTFRITVTSKDCYFQVTKGPDKHEFELDDSLRPLYVWGSPSLKEIQRILCAVALTPEHRKGRLSGLKCIKSSGCLLCGCSSCKYTPLFSSKCAKLFPRSRHGRSTRYPNPMHLDTTINVLTEIFPLIIDSTLVIGPLAGLVTPPFDLARPEIRQLLHSFHTLKFTLTGIVTCNDISSLGYAREFLKELLEVVLSNPQPMLQNLDLLVLRYGRYHSAKLARYCRLVIDVVLSFFSPSKSSDVVPFLCLKGLKIKVKPVKQEIKKFVHLVTHQEQLESLELVCVKMCEHPNSSYDPLLDAAGQCFQKPTFQCLTLKDFHVTTSTVLDIQHKFLVSTACEQQKLVLKNLVIDSSAVRRRVSYSFESAACKKSLSVTQCSLSDVGLFSAVDIASGILSHPGTKSLDMSSSLDRVDLYKLTTALEAGAGTLRLLDLTGCNLSSIAVRAGPLFQAIFSLPHLSELELVLDHCRLDAEDMQQLYRMWEMGGHTKKRKRQARQSLRKLSVCGNFLPEDRGNLELMAQSLSYPP